MSNERAMLTSVGVLLLECDQGVEEALRADRELANFSVFCLTAREQAEELLTRGRIDVLVIDLDGRGEKTFTWLARMIARRPHLRIIGVCGPENRAIKGRLGGIRVWIEKPLDEKRLGALVSEVAKGVPTETLREDLLRRRDAPLFVSEAYSHWGINE